jgi:hypothetical protein
MQEPWLQWLCSLGSGTRRVDAVMACLRSSRESRFTEQELG